MPWFLGNSRPMMQTFDVWWPFLPFLMVWSFIWTGLSLWYAARRDEKGWFVFFLLVHTAGIVELVYLFFIVKAFNNNAKSKKSRK